MPVKMTINIHDIPKMIDRLVHLKRVEDCTRLKRVNVTFAVHSQKQHAHLKNLLTKQNGKRYEFAWRVLLHI